MRSCYLSNQSAPLSRGEGYLSVWSYILTRIGDTMTVPPATSTANQSARDLADQDFCDAFECVLTQPLDRRMLLTVYRSGRELRYEELRKSVGSPHKQSFADALDRLLSQILVIRRYVPKGQRYQTLVSPTPRGTVIAKITFHLSREGSLPDDLPPRLSDLVKRVFSGDFDDSSHEQRLSRSAGG